ncbi:MAG: prolyl oligopeptidase family serine peptidase [Pseudomonadota bacterium]
MVRVFAALAALFLLFPIIGAHAQPPLEVYGQLPNLRLVAISPNGERIAFVRDTGDGEFVSALDLKTGKSFGAVGTAKIKVRSLYFASDDYVIFTASDTIGHQALRGEMEFSVAFSWDLKTNRRVQLLDGSKDLYGFQSGLGRVVGLAAGENEVFMPAFTGVDSEAPPYSLMKVDLKSGRGSIHSRGTPQTIDWFVDKDGEIIAREDFDDDRNRYTIWAYEGKETRPIYQEEGAFRSIGVIGVKNDKSALIVSVRFKGDDFSSLAEMSFDGKITKRIYARDDADVEAVLSDRNRFVYGVRYSGLTPSYEFSDPDLTELMLSLPQQFPNASVALQDVSADLSDIVIFVQGGVTAPSYHAINVPDRKFIGRIGSAYDSITNKNVAEVLTIEYAARDGEKIPAVVTLPLGVEDMAGRHPGIILPHGGPESYDSVRFDWMAQYFASRGYVVMQPNFRGSDGFGASFRQAGHGEWGRGVMQHDVTDGFQALVASNIIDPDRTCIAGASYGGYAALAGGAYTPDLYACIVAIAPVTDLRVMLRSEKRQSGSDSWVNDYWARLIGDPKSEEEKLKSISPSEFASDFTAPVLLIHGVDDTVVPMRQSQIMKSALDKAGKDVTFVKLKGEDHWLSTSETRLETLRAMDEFISQHIGGAN